MAAPLLADPRLIERCMRPLGSLARYHRHTVVGLEKVPDEGAALMVFNHSLATYDAVLFSRTLWEEKRRLPVGLGDNLIFRVPGLSSFARRVGIVPANPENGHRLLNEGHLVAVAPGGMREALRPSAERGSIRWDRRRGFVRLALETGTPIILVACPAADDLYRVYENRLTKLAYKNWRVPVPLIRGVGPTWIPRPVQLVHTVGDPIVPPTLEGPVTQDDVEALHEVVIDTMNRLMDEDSGD